MKYKIVNKSVHLILKALKVTGGLTLTMIAPSIAKDLGLIDIPDKPWERPLKRTNEIIRRLRNNGCITIDRGRRYTLTNKGFERLARYELKTTEIGKQKRWDKKWRVVIFDVREKRRYCRDLIRESLQKFGFIRLQDSVWVFPYPCEELIELARTAHGVRHDALYLVCGRFIGDEMLAYNFGLDLHPNV